MSAPTLQVIEALRAEHELLAPLTSSLSDAQLATRSCAAEWTLAQVLSHLGSGAQIMLAALRGGLGQAEPPAADANQQVWARWDALSPREQAEQFRTYDEELVAAFEALDDGQRESGSFTVGTLPFPFSTAGFAGLRLNEVALHS